MLSACSARYNRHRTTRGRAWEGRLREGLERTLSPPAQPPMAALSRQLEEDSTDHIIEEEDLTPLPMKLLSPPVKVQADGPSAEA